MALGAGRWGQLDLAGNVSEWNLDWSATENVNPCTDCANLAAATSRVDQGGSFVDSILEAGGPSATAPALRNSGIGVRCARTP